MTLDEFETLINETYQSFITEYLDSSTLQRKLDQLQVNGTQIPNEQLIGFCMSESIRISLQVMTNVLTKVLIFD